MADLARHANLTDEIGEAGTLLELVARGRPAWQSDAAYCEHPEVSWFPELGDDVRPAKAVCAGCLVRRECRGGRSPKGPNFKAYGRARAAGTAAGYEPARLPDRHLAQLAGEPIVQVLDGTVK